MYQEIENAVTELLAQAGVTYSAVNRGVKKNALDGTAPMDQWECTFTRGERSESFDYFTGMGHRAPVTAKQKQETAWGFQGLTENDKKGLTNYGRRYLAKVEELRKPVAPHAAGVLSSLILNSSASEQSFYNWCADFGYDTDSRKALATYEACQKSGEKMGRVMGHALVEKLREALQDY